MLVTNLPSTTWWAFPEDQVAGKEAFLGQWKDPVESWIRAYAFTQRELANALLQAASEKTPQHIAADRSQTVENKEQLTLLKECAEHPFIDVTILTSTEGTDYIAHSKTTVGSDGRYWMGSWNFSESASRQVNHAIQGASAPIRDAVIAQFQTDVKWAWLHEKGFQITGTPPPGVTLGEVEGKA
jgi:hypothetical protein